MHLSIGLTCKLTLIYAKATMQCYSGFMLKQEQVARSKKINNGTLEIHTLQRR